MAGTEVSFRETLSYGVRLIGLLAMLAILTAVIVGIGFAVGGFGDDAASTGQMVAGVVIFIVGGIVLYGGIFGVIYKVQADAVARGMRNSGEQKAPSGAAFQAQEG